MFISVIDSTNTLLLRLIGADVDKDKQLAAYLPCLDEQIPVLYTDCQTAGRGQTGNSWESEPHKNLLFSYLLRQPDISISQAFALNMLAACTLHQTVTHLLPKKIQSRLTIKWPNDLYFDDKKLAGILVENTLLGNTIAASVTGIGLNINQENWLSKAPNPISLKLITGQSYDVHEVMNLFLKTLSSNIDLSTNTLHISEQSLHSYFMVHLYRREGWYTYRERDVNINPTEVIQSNTSDSRNFIAKVEDVSFDGRILLSCLPYNELNRTSAPQSTPQHRAFHFKQIQFVL